MAGLEQRYDEVILISTGPQERPEVDRERVCEGARHYHSAKASHEERSPCIVLSGVYNNGVYEGSQIERMRDTLIKSRDMDPKNIFLEDRSNTFREKGVYVTQMAMELLGSEVTNGIAIPLDKQQEDRMRLAFQRARVERELPYIPLNIISFSEPASYVGVEGLWKPTASYYLDRFARVPEPLPQREIRRMLRIPLKKE